MDARPQCVGTSVKTGVRCRRPAVTGLETCFQHQAERIENGPLVSPRCVATSRTRGGERCKNPAMAGATVCRFHGGATQHVRKKAALRLAALVDPAIGTLAREMVKADRSSDRQRAANSILDRAGIVRKQDGEAEIARSLLVERLRAIRDEALRQGAGEDVGELPVLEAEVVDG